LLMSMSMSVSMWSLRWHFTKKSVTGAPYSIKSYSLSHSWTLRCRVRWLKHAVPSWGRGGTAATMAQNEQLTEEHSTLEQQSPIATFYVDFSIACRCMQSTECPLVLQFASVVYDVSRRFFGLCIRWSDVTDSMVTIESPFRGHNTI